MPVPPDSSPAEATVKQVARKTPAGVWVIVCMSIFLIIAGLGISAFIFFKALGGKKAATPVFAQETVPAHPDSALQTSTESTATPAPSPSLAPSSEKLKPSDPSEEEETRQEVLQRIDIKKDLTERDKDQLYVQVEKSRGFSKIALISFPEGKSSPGASQIQSLIRRLQQKDVQDKLKDPTTLLFVLGFADLQGDETKNLEISRTRAENVIRELKSKTELVNVMHPVPMGGQSLIDSTKPERNRLVEVWLAQP
jgi:outer membrane protein OmpA-like peptidoglycan-associated protein